MSIQKFVCDAYEIHQNGEYAVMYLREFPASQASPNPTYGGQLTIQSSFGTFGYTWSVIAKPFKQFLTTLSFDYLMEKCMGSDFKVFSGNASFAAVMRQLERLVEDESIPAEHKDEIAESLKNNLDSIWGPSDFLSAMEEAQSEVEELHPGVKYLFENAQEYISTVPNVQAVSFWRELWPVFVEQLKSELGDS